MLLHKPKCHQLQKFSDSNSGKNPAELAPWSTGKQKPLNEVQPGSQVQFFTLVRRKRRSISWQRESRRSWVQLIAVTQSADQMEYPLAANLRCPSNRAPKKLSAPAAFPTCVPLSLPVTQWQCRQLYTNPHWARRRARICGHSDGINGCNSRTPAAKTSTRLPTVTTSAM